VALRAIEEGTQRVETLPRVTLLCSQRTCLSKQRRAGQALGLQSLVFEGEREGSLS